MPQERNPKIVQEFTRRRTLQLILIPVMIAVTTLLGWNQGHGGDFLVTVSGRLLIGVIVVAVLFSVRNWRCPACNGYLGKALSPNFCRNCGVPLR